MKKEDNFNKRMRLGFEAMNKSSAEKKSIKEIEIESNKSTIRNNKFNKVVGILNLIFVIIGVLLTAILLYLTIKD
mgnify:CR=1 FL=1